MRMQSLPHCYKGSFSIQTKGEHVAKDESNQTDAKSSLGSTLNLIEKSWEWSWVMRATTVVLFLDIALIVKSGHGLLREFLNLGIWKVLRWFRNGEDRYREPRGSVLSGTLRDRALRDHSDFLMQLYEKHRNDKQTREQARETQDDLLFSFLCLICLDLWMVLSGRASTSLAYFVVDACGENAAPLIMLFGS